MQNFTNIVLYDTLFTSSFKQNRTETMIDITPEMLKPLQPLFQALQTKWNRFLTPDEEKLLAAKWFGAREEHVWSCSICQRDDDTTGLAVRSLEYHWLNSGCFGESVDAEHAEVHICLDCFLAGWIFPYDDKWSGPMLYNLLTNATKSVH